jgi:hypothetical protein
MFTSAITIMPHIDVDRAVDAARSGEVSAFHGCGQYSLERGYLLFKDKEDDEME